MKESQQESSESDKKQKGGGWNDKKNMDEERAGCEDFLCMCLEIA